MEYRTLHMKGITLNTIELEKYLEKLASDQILKTNSDGRKHISNSSYKREI